MFCLGHAVSAKKGLFTLSFPLAVLDGRGVVALLEDVDKLRRIRVADLSAELEETSIAPYQKED